VIIVVDFVLNPDLKGDACGAGRRSIMGNKQADLIGKEYELMQLWGRRGDCLCFKTMIKIVALAVDFGHGLIGAISVVADLAEVIIGTASEIEN
jgi:hypothetical protein